MYVHMCARTRRLWWQEKKNGSVGEAALVCKNTAPCFAVLVNPPLSRPACSVLGKPLLIRLIH